MASKIKKGMIAACAFLGLMGGLKATNAGAEEIVFGDRAKEPVKQELPVGGLDSKVDSNKKDDKKSKWGLLADLAEVAAGAGAQYLIHKAGHGVGAAISGTDIKYTDSLGNWEYQTRDRSNIQIIATRASGFGLPLLISQKLLDNDKVPKNNPWVAGLIIGPALHNLIYVAADATNMLNKDYNDIEEMDRAGMGRGITYPLLLGISAIQTYRLVKEIKKSKKSGFNVWVNPPVGRSGFNAGITYRF